MKIAIASDDGRHVAMHTGRCQGFAIFEVANHTATQTEYRRNTFTAHARGECSGEHDPAGHTGHHSHEPLLTAIADCCVLVTRGLGPRLVQDLAAYGIETFVCTAEDVETAARQYAEGQLQRMKGTGCCRH